MSKSFLEARMAEAKKLGDMLKDAGLIDDYKLQSALSYQRSWGGKLGAILIELNLVAEAELAGVIAEKLRIPYINLFEPEVSREVVRLIKPEVAKKYHVMPAKKEGAALVLAMMDPLDIEATDEIRFITGLTIKPTLALESEIRDAILKYYDGENIVRKRAPAVHERENESHGKMEIIHGTDLSMPEEIRSGAPSPIPSGGGLDQHSQGDDRMRVDALITLLIEKGIITRDEFVSMVQGIKK
jgi:type IV pilus assembly protein PilB